MDGNEVIDNPTRKFIAEAVASVGSGIALTCNAAFIAQNAVIEWGQPGNVRLSFTAGPETAQGNGVVSGGALASMLDSAMAVAALSALKPGENCATISLTVNMLRPGMLGNFACNAIVEKLGRSVAFVGARLEDCGGKTVATASSSMAVFIRS